MHTKHRAMKTHLYRKKRKERIPHVLVLLIWKLYTRPHVYTYSTYIDPEQCTVRRRCIFIARQQSPPPFFAVLYFTSPGRIVCRIKIKNPPSR